MTRIVSSHVEVHVFRRRALRIEFLCLRRAPKRAVLPGVWQPITGKRERGERAPAAALRELREETGLVPVRLWALEHVTLYYDHARDALRVLPVFAAEVASGAKVKLSAEHDRWQFLGARAAGRRYLWESQRAALAALRREVLGPKPLARALEVAAKPRPRSRRR